VDLNAGKFILEMNGGETPEQDDFKAIIQSRLESAMRVDRVRVEFGEKLGDLALTPPVKTLMNASAKSMNSPPREPTVNQEDAEGPRQSLPKSYDAQGVIDGLKALGLRPSEQRNVVSRDVKNFLGIFDEKKRRQPLSLSEDQFSAYVKHWLKTQNKRATEKKSDSSKSEMRPIQKGVRDNGGKSMGGGPWTCDDCKINMKPQMPACARCGKARP
jgi:hypothetical protein